MSDLLDFLLPVSLSRLNHDETYNDFQIGSQVLLHDTQFPDWEPASVVLVGTGEQRGAGTAADPGYPDEIRRQLYRLYHWHEGIVLADLGNIRQGATLQDTYAALKTVVHTLVTAGKTVLILGGSHDLTTAQYQAYVLGKKIVEATVVDALIDLQETPHPRSAAFLMDMLTGQPNYVRHYNHIGFQSYFVHPRMLETLDKLRFDCYRLGKARENLEEIEPVLRNSDMLSFDICAIRRAEAPAAGLSPNGFSGDEACMLARFAGMSLSLSSFGIYGYNPLRDPGGDTALQIAQMIWYFIDGKSVHNREAPLEEKTAFLEFYVTFTDVATTFIKSKKTGRWWMQLPGGQYIPCAYSDYLAACNNEIPERWLRAQERLS
ncbi:formimidoylglutamase [Compostibacter hankyongensis]|uniref:Formimidoylglutamase n=1 Tax=Compostibacter hankyongensis TaxID=1007089 RepID=A0ABP8FD47_9BACT